MSNYSKVEEFNNINVEELTKENLIHNIGKAIGFIPVLDDEGCSVVIITSFDIADVIVKMSDKQLLCSATSETFYKPHSTNHEKVRVRKSFNYVLIDNFYISVLSDNNLDPTGTMVIMYNGV